MSKKLERLAAKLGSAGYTVYSDGGKIHIKPSHRGRLTELKERTGKSEEELYNDGNPAHKKMVVFARNARQWRHDTGGPLGSEEGDIPAAVVTPRPENVALYTYGVSGNYPITHSRLVGNGLLIDKGRVDPSYNLLKANCADATGDIIGGWNNIDLTYGLTTPKSIQNATRSIYGNTPEYRERRMPGVTIQSFQVPWYDLRTARDAANQMEFDRVTAGMSPEEIEEVRRSYNRDLPKLPYYIDQNGNVIPVQQSYTRGGMLRVLATGGQTYGIDDRSRSGDRYYDVVKARYEGVMDALKRRGFGYNDAARVAPMIIMQNNLEGGWTVNRKDNNFGGMKAGNKVISYDSVGDFYDAYLDMLDSKWGGDKDSPDNWRNAKDIKDWARILNHEDLGLDTEEKFKAYNRTHRDNPVYLYAPEWDNGGKKYGETLGGVQNRTLAYLDMVTADSPYENWTAAAVREKLSGLPKIQSTLSSNPGLVKALLEARTGPHNYIEWKARRQKVAGGRINTFAGGGDAEEEEVPQYSQGSAIQEVAVPPNMENIDDAADFVRNYYKSDGYLRRLSDSGLPAVPLNISPNILPIIEPVNNSFALGKDIFIGVKPPQLTFPVVNHPITGRPLLDVGQIHDNENSLGFFPAAAAAHEAAHLNPLYNTRYKDWYREDRHYKELSPYYGNDYSNVPGYYMYILAPNKEVNDHDKEASENYSDLMALRYYLQKNGLFDSMDKTAVFTSEDYDKIFETEGGKHLRFIKNHSKDAVIKAINDIAQVSEADLLAPDSLRV